MGFVFLFFKKDGQFRVALVAYHMGPRLFLSFYCAILVMVPILKVTSWSSMAAGAPAIRFSIHLGCKKKKRKMKRVCFSAEAALFKELSYKLYHIFTYLVVKEIWECDLLSGTISAPNKIGILFVSKEKVATSCLYHKGDMY